MFTLILCTWSVLSSVCVGCVLCGGICVVWCTCGVLCVLYMCYVLWCVVCMLYMEMCVVWVCVCCVGMCIVHGVRIFYVVCVASKPYQPYLSQLFYQNILFILIDILIFHSFFLIFTCHLSHAQACCLLHISFDLIGPLSSLPLASISLASNICCLGVFYFK